MNAVSQIPSHIPSSIKLGADLSSRELEVLSLIAAGFQYKAIGRLLGISHRTAQIYGVYVRVKLGALSLPHAVALGIDRGILREDAGSATRRATLMAATLMAQPFVNLTDDAMCANRVCQLQARCDRKNPKRWRNHGPLSYGAFSPRADGTCAAHIPYEGDTASLSPKDVAGGAWVADESEQPTGRQSSQA